MKTLIKTLNAPRPKTRKNWEGIETKIKWPKGKTIARCGEVYLIQTKKNSFAVVYGLLVIEDFSRKEASAEFGQSCIHQAECENLFRNA